MKVDVFELESKDVYGVFMLLGKYKHDPNPTLRFATFCLSADAAVRYGERRIATDPLANDFVVVEGGINWYGKVYDSTEHKEEENGSN